MGRRLKDPIANWWSKVDKRGPDECWPWLGGTDRDGYGKFQVGLGGKQQRHVKAHRYGWEILVGPIPDGMVVCHSCDNPPCENRMHWFLGTNQDNVNDRQAKGRGAQVWGEPLNRSRQTHCKRNHPLEGDNLWINPKTGHRICKACGRAATLRSYYRNGPSKRPIVRCVDCGEDRSHRANGRCAKCDQRRRRAS